MRTDLEALEKIDHTVCLAFNEDNASVFNKDDIEHIDCNDVFEFADCIEQVKVALIEAEETKAKAKAFEVLRAHFDITVSGTDIIIARRKAQ